MKMFSSLLILFLFTSCATDPAENNASKDGNKNTQTKEQEVFPELEYVTDQDFAPPKMVVYKSYQDRYQENPEMISDSLAPETLDKSEVGGVPNYAENDDPISTISSLCYKKDFNQAFALSDKIYAKYKKHPSYWTQLGTCYYLFNEKRKALLYYNKAIEINPNYAPPVNNLGVLFLEQGHDQKALVAFKKAVTLNRFSLTPKFNLAHLYLEYGLVDDSLKIFESLYNLNSQDGDILSGLGNAHLFKGDVEISLKYFKSIPEQYLSRADVSLNYSVAMRLVGQNQEATNI